MDSLEAGLEAQSSRDEQRKQRCFPMNLISKGKQTLSSLKSTPPHNPAAEFLTNLKSCELKKPPVESVSMTPEIFSVMRGGNIEFLGKMKSYGTPMPYFMHDKGDSILHLAAAWGHLELVKGIIIECPYLLLEPNSKGQLPLHVAARAGHLTVVEALIETVTFFSANTTDDVQRERLKIYVLKDINGDTALHLALKDLHKKAELILYQRRIRLLQSPRRRIRVCSFPDTSTRQMKIGACLVKANQHASFLATTDGVSPLYMATEAGNVSLVNAMLDNISNLTSRLEGRKSLVHAALKSKNIEVLDYILNKAADLVNELDEDGRTCLSVGASVGFYEGICKLLEESTSKVYECDSDGSFSIHMAVEKGHMDIAKELLKRCPDSEYLLSKQGQNILHIAAKSGKAESFLYDYVKRVDTRNHLIEEQDVDGNTPLHIATINWRPRTLRNLTDFALTNPKILNVKNNGGWTAYEIAELKLQSEYIFRERMTLVVLLCVYAPLDFLWVPLSGMTLRGRSKQHRSVDKKYKDQINILLLVAALVATMTFAAGFTMPGGFNSSAPNSGMAILAKDKNLTYFLLSDSVAMQCSVVAIVALIWAQLGDLDILHRALRVALPMLFAALTFMSLAFIYGVLATVKKNKFLYYWLSATAAIFYSAILLIFVPYIAPHHNARFVLPLLLRFVNEDDAEKHHTSGSCESCLKRVKSGGSSTSSDD